MSRALIGHTGFVGGNLRAQTEFDDLFNSSNVGDIDGRAFELVVCAAAPAVKWKANKHPDEDLAAIRRLTDRLERVRAAHFVLISTVDVYPVPIDVDEDTPIDPDAGAAYGRHRLQLERFVVERFDTTVIRLPGLFGKGLKKNVVYDFLHDNQVDRIHPEGVFQFYDLETLWADVQTARRHELRLVNFATEPVSVRDLALEAFGLDLPSRDAEGAARYDFRTRNAACFGGADGYLQDRVTVLARMRRFVEREGWVRP